MLKAFTHIGSVRNKRVEMQLALMVEEHMGMEELLNYGTVEWCRWWRPTTCLDTPPASSWRQLGRSLMLKQIRSQSITMGSLVELLKQG